MIAAPDAAIRATGLTKYFGPVVGIEELSFEVGRGEIYGFLGANGAGKTTTIRLLLDLLRPSRGSARVLGRDCHRDQHEDRDLGSQPQSAGAGSGGCAASDRALGKECSIGSIPGIRSIL